MRFGCLCFAAALTLAPGCGAPQPVRKSVDTRQIAMEAPEAIPPPTLRTITLEWSNPPGGGMLTGLVASQDLASWQEVTNLPWSAGIIRVTLTNRPALEFYRAFNR